MFLTSGSARKSRYTGAAGLSEQRKSYHTLVKENQGGQAQINQAIQERVDNVLDQPKKKLYQQGRI